MEGRKEEQERGKEWRKGGKEGGREKRREGGRGGKEGKESVFRSKFNVQSTTSSSILK